MTGASQFTNNKVPTTVGLPGDPSLINFVQAFPLHWQGFAQIRLFFTAVNSQAYINTYPAANVFVSGNTWTQVGGGNVNCKAGQALSDENDLKVAHKQLTQGGRAASTSSGKSSPGSSRIRPAHRAAVRQVGTLEQCGGWVGSRLVIEPQQHRP